MITEAQRRALFALREALHLCEGADVSLSHDLDHLRLDVGRGLDVVTLEAGHIGSAEVAQFLVEHPE
jgi:hypothetical protein